MHVNQTQDELLRPGQRVALQWNWLTQSRLRRRVRLVGLLCLALLLMGGSALTATEEQERKLAMQVAGWEFDLFRWEFQALSQKVRTDITQPAKQLTPPQAAQLVRDYLARAQQIARLEDQLNKLYSEQQQATTQAGQIQKQLDDLRQLQRTNRPVVEQVIEEQIGRALAAHGMQLYGIPLPPVQFTFVEPPRKLVVSPRAKIETLYGEMLAPEMPLAAIEKSEHAIRQAQDLSAYITNIGGLGAFPTMVVDRASLDWILSTVAHEWTHNYLAFYPLGMSYFASADLTTLNETVAEIVGNEIGRDALQTFYPEAVPPATPAPADSDTANKNVEPPPPAFDFNAAMRETRVTVDQLLAAGQVAQAEQYMEARRLIFVQHGYPLRVLNQAYFAFNGSYGTSAASTSPIGPKLFLLRHLTPDLHIFLTEVRGMKSPTDLDAALARWEALDAKK